VLIVPPSASGAFQGTSQVNQCELTKRLPTTATRTNLSPPFWRRILAGQDLRCSLTRAGIDRCRGVPSHESGDTPIVLIPSSQQQPSTCVLRQIVPGRSGLSRTRCSRLSLLPLPGLSAPERGRLIAASMLRQHYARYVRPTVYGAKGAGVLTSANPELHVSHSARRADR
jgi:hypothetical protein